MLKELHQAMNRSLGVKCLSGWAVATASLGLTAVMQSPASAASLIPVDLELSLLVDVSPSVNAQEYDLQIGGYRDAFMNLAPLFDEGEFGSVAVNFIQWAGSNKQEESIPWTLIEDGNSALQFADSIEAVTRPLGFFSTAPGSAIQFATNLFDSNDYEGRLWVIDVSGDGRQNSGVATSLARDNALDAGVDAINGLPIETSSLGFLESWYRGNIQGGDGSFVIAADGFDNFGQAVEQKLRLELALSSPGPQPDTEISPEAVPEPNSLFGIALIGSLVASLKYRYSDV